MPTQYAGRLSALAVGDRIKVDVIVKQGKLVLEASFGYHDPLAPESARGIKALRIFSLSAEDQLRLYDGEVWDCEVIDQPRYLPPNDKRGFGMVIVPVRLCQRVEHYEQKVLKPQSDETPAELVFVKMSGKRELDHLSFSLTTATPDQYQLPEGDGRMLIVQRYFVDEILVAEEVVFRGPVSRHLQGIPVDADAYYRRLGQYPGESNIPSPDELCAQLLAAAAVFSQHQAEV